MKTYVALCEGMKLKSLRNTGLCEVVQRYKKFLADPLTECYIYT